MSTLPHILNHEELATFLTQAGATGDFAEDVLEKDLWLVWCLEALFRDPTLAAQLSFKGGTSLSKAYGAITRFSEDVDLTIDHRVFNDPFDPLAETSTTPSRNKAKAFRERVEGDHMPRFLRTSILPRLQAFAQETLDEGRQPSSSSARERARSSSRIPTSALHMGTSKRASSSSSVVAWGSSPAKPLP